MRCNLKFCYSLILGLIALVALTFAATAAEKVSDKSAATEDLSTNMSFEDLLVKGKYHFSDEAVATVEDDKVLDALLGVRKDFKDRVKRSASRH